MSSPAPRLFRFGVMAKFAAGFAALFLCAAGLGGFALDRLNAVEADSHEIGGHWLQTTRVLGDVIYQGQRFRTIEAALAMAPPADQAKEAKTLGEIRQAIEADFAAQGRLAQSREEETDLSALKSTWEAYLKLDDRFVSAAKQSNEAASALYRTEMRDSIRAFQNAVKAAVQKNVARADAATVASDQLGRAAERDLYIGVGLAALIVLLVSWRLNGSLVAPIRRLTEAMTRLASGATDVEIPALKRADEIGEMARASAVFRDAARDRRQELEREAATQRAAARAERDSSAVERERATQAQEKAMQALGGALRALSQGDLMHRLPTDFPREFFRLRQDFEEARDKLGATLWTLASSTATLAAECHALGAGADELSERTERQAANLEQSSTALGEITATVKVSSASAAEAHNVATAADAEARRGAAVVRDAVAAMDGLSQSAREIRDITGGIDEIAFQTSLLSLNAGVEAARAGEAGRGFAVVATEVRALASRSAEMARRIGELISNSDKQVAAGVAKVAATGEALNRIAGEIARLNHIVETIATGAGEQARRLDEVNGAVKEMDQVTQRNAAMVQQTTAATRKLRDEIGALEGLVREFRLEEAQQAA